MKSFTDIVRDAVREQFADDFLVEPGPLAESLRRRLHAEGYAVHDTRWCVRIPPSMRHELGRPMTEEERIRLLAR